MERTTSKHKAVRNTASSTVDQQLSDDITTVSSSASDTIDLPPHWELRQSRSYKGRIYYANRLMNKVTWVFPIFKPCAEDCNLCQTYEAEKNNQIIHGDESIVKINKRIKNHTNSTPVNTESTVKHDGINLKSMTSPVCAKSSPIDNKLSTSIKSKRLRNAQSRKRRKLKKKVTCETSASSMTINERKTEDTSCHSPSNQMNTKNKCKITNDCPNKFISTFEVSDSTLAPSPVKEDFSKKTAESTSSDISKNDPTINQTTPKIKNSSSDKQNRQKFVARRQKNWVSITDLTTLPETQKIENRTARKQSVNQYSGDKSVVDDDPKISNDIGISPLHEIQMRPKLIAKRRIDKELTSKEQFSKTKQEQSVNTSQQVKRPCVQNENDAIILESRTEIKKDANDDRPDVMDVDEELKCVRQDTSYAPNEALNFNVQDLCKDYAHDCCLFILDTNILISFLPLVERLACVHSTYNGLKCIVVIPYTALVELDRLKMKDGCAKNARAAIRWCETSFSKSNSNVLGQSFQNFSSLRDTMGGTEGDDRIRDWCLFLEEQRFRVMLFTNDANFRNKAMMANIKVITPQTITHELLSSTDVATPIRSNSSQCVTPQRQTYSIERKSARNSEKRKQQEQRTSSTPINLNISADDNEMDVTADSPIKNINISNTEINNNSEQSTITSAEVILSLEKTLGNILIYVMKDAFGDLWETIIIRKPPWSLKDIFACWKKHWIAAFLDKFPSSVQKLIKHIESLCVSVNDHSNSKLISECSRLYKHFNKPPFSNLVEKFDVELSSRESNRCNNLETNNKKYFKAQHNGTANSQSNKDILYNRNENVMPRNLSINESYIESEKDTSTVACENLAQKALVATGNQMKSFVTQIASIDRNNASKEQQESVSKLGACVDELRQAILRCANSVPDAATGLRYALQKFWANAPEGAAQLEYVSSDQGLADISNFVRLPTSKEFFINCVRDLHYMTTELMSYLTSFRMEENSCS